MRILGGFKESGYRVEYWNPCTNFIPCYVNKKYYNAINYNGDIIKCTATDDLYHNSSIGKLNNDGTINWLTNINNSYIQPTFENERCLNCKKLPICMGLCPREHINKADYCKEDAMDVGFEESIVFLIDKDYNY